MSTVQIGPKLASPTYLTQATKGRQPIPETGDPWHGAVAAPVNSGGHRRRGRWGMVLEREGSVETRFGAHRCRESHRGVVLHSGMLDNAEPLMVLLAALKGSASFMEPRRCMWGSRQGWTRPKPTGRW
jgi:hypothetical protein